MKDFNDLLSVWQGQPKQVRLSVDDVLKQVKKGVNKLKSKTLIGLIAVGISMAVIVAVALFMPIKSQLTYIGLAVWIVSFAIVIVMQMGDYRTIATLDATTDPPTYISHLKLYKKRRAVMNGRFFYYYALAVSFGVMFYSFEFISRSSIYIMIGFYVGWLVYLAFVLFFLKKKLIERENRRVADLLDQLERLQQQFE
ncbi:hypothetical protein GCM10027037_08280 [Mucilaginibacter koreensis]